MKDPIEIKGYWWLPNNPEIQLPGTLTFSQEEGGILEVLGFFEDPWELNREENPKIILGINQKGIPITLQENISINSQISTNGLGESKYLPRFILEGVHFEREEDFKFHSIEGNYTDLDAWVDTSGFLIDTQYTNEEYSTSIECKRPKKQLIKISENFEVGVEFSISGPIQMKIPTEVKIVQKAFLVINSLNGDVSFGELFSMLNKFVNLMQIGVQRICYPFSIIGYTKHNEEIYSNEKKYYPEVKIYYRPIESYVTKKDKLPDEMFFTFQDLSEENIRQWFNAYERHQTQINLYRSLFYTGRLFIETKFLNIVQSLESLHSLTFDDCYLPSEEYRKNRNKVIVVVPDNLREWVKGALANSNYKRLKEKIIELFENKKGLFSDVIEDIDLFAKKIRDTRNELVHHRELRWMIKDKEELISAIYLMTYLFELYMLEIVGFSEEKVEAMNKKRMDRYLTRWKKF